MSTSWFGVPVHRREDERLVKGQGCFLADIDLPDMVHVAFVRSVHARAEISGIDTAAARAMQGVLEIITASDLGDSGVPFPQLLPYPDFVSATWSALASGCVRFLGEAVTAVVAESQLLAVEASEYIHVNYAALAPVLDMEAAVREDAELVHSHAPRNLALHLVRETGDVSLALAEAPCRLKERFHFTRGAGMPLETRGVVASFDSETGEVTVWSSTQEPHRVKNLLAGMLGMPAHLVRVIAPDTGGGFGTKLNVYPEEIVVPWLARKLKRPVRWVETRSEHMVSATQERDQIHDIEIGFDREGRILAASDVFYHDMGAYAPRGGVVPYNTLTSTIGAYRIPAYRSEMKAVYTNRAVVAAYRAAGQQQGTFVIERIMDRIALDLGKDPADVRRVNMVTPDLFPYDTGVPGPFGSKIEYDSGDFLGSLDSALKAVEYQELRRLQAKARAEGRHFGIGIAAYVELTGLGPWESAGVRVEADGRVIVFTGAPSQGQGHQTIFAQICADQLSVPLDCITVTSGDTALISDGFGTYASRIGVLAGNAVNESAIIVKNKLLDVAEEIFETSKIDLVLENGGVALIGAPASKINFAEIVRRAPRTSELQDTSPSLEATHNFNAPKITYACGTHVVALEVDPETGRVEIFKYAVAHDCGRVINPMIVEGQIHGGIVCGIGNALLEQHIYDDSGQLSTGSFMDYAMPGAVHVPDIVIVHQETPSQLNPLGIKGVGEGGTIPVPAAIANAVEDALAPLQIPIRQYPLTPLAIWQLINKGAAP